MTELPDYEAAWEMFKRGDRTRERLVWVIDAALGDEPLYRQATVVEWATAKFDRQDMPVVKVWPLEVSDDS